MNNYITILSSLRIISIVTTINTEKLLKVDHNLLHQSIFSRFKLIKNGGLYYFINV